MSAVNDVECDVVVVGAGLSGLVAARRLSRAGLDVHVVEARDRVGGRLYTEETMGSRRFHADLGGQWVGPEQTHILGLLDELEVETFAQYNEGQHCLFVDGKRHAYRGDIPSIGALGLVNLQWAFFRINRLSAALDPRMPHRWSEAKKWDAMTVETWLRRHLKDPRAMSCMVGLVRAVFAAEPCEVSMLQFLFYMRSGNGVMSLAGVEGGAQQDKLVGGAQKICEKLARPMEKSLHLESPVRRISQDNSSVTVVCDEVRITADFAVVAMAPAMWGAIDWEPALCGSRMQLSQRMPMGSVIKSVAFYEEAFWRERGFSGQFVDDSGVVQLGFDYTLEEGQPPALVGFIVGAAARKWTRRSEADRKAAVLSSFARIFGDQALEPICFLQKDWLADRWAQGCYVGMMAPGAWAEGGEVIRRPQGRIHWAGTETAVEGNGYMDGAVEAGMRAAREITARQR